MQYNSGTKADVTLGCLFLSKIDVKYAKGHKTQYSDEQHPVLRNLMLMETVYPNTPPFALSYIIRMPKTLNN